MSATTMFRRSSHRRHAAVSTPPWATPGSTPGTTTRCTFGAYAWPAEQTSFDEPAAPSPWARRLVEAPR